MSEGVLGQSLRNQNQFSTLSAKGKLKTRKELLKQISEAYNFPLDFSIQNQLPAYPWESNPL